MRTLKQGILILGLSWMALSPAFSADSLIFAMDVIRHGDRTPTKVIPTVPYVWSDGLGQLTAKGMQQEYQLGQAFRKEYIEETHLLPDHYSFGTLKALSTDTDRTRMSAESCLLGLYPLGTGPKLGNDFALPQGFQPIPVAAVPKKAQWPMEEYNEDIETRLSLTPAWVQKTKALAPNFERWSQAMGITIQNIAQLDELGNVLWIYQQNGIPLPQGLTETDIKTMEDTGVWAMLTPLRDPKILRITGRPLFHLIVKDLSQAAENKSAVKYELIAAHDTTLLSLLSVMGVPISEQPPYASDLNFELFQSEKTQYLSVKFNGNLVSIPACGGTKCSLTALQGI